jgi:NAD(P)-dependent dehydrogenase (short-subunit alcohol dehydrogenase family)
MRGEGTVLAAYGFDVTGRGAIVTGGASGIGLAYAEAMAENGGRVTLIDLDAVALERETARLAAAGWDVRGAVADVSDRAALDDAVAEAAAAYGGLDIAFANAGIDPGIGFTTADHKQRVPGGEIENYRTDRWARVIDINLSGVFYTISAAARHMKPKGAGSIIVTTSIAATEIEGAIGAAYMAAKAGAAHLMRNAALELAAHGIRVNAIAPGYFVTNIGGGWLKDPAAQAEIAKLIPLRRPAVTAELKPLALYLASPASGFVTGSEIMIDGGFHLGPAQ